MIRTARGVAWHVLERVERDGAWADLVLHAALRDTELERRDRALATELAYGALRLRGRLDAALAQVCDRKLEQLESKLLNLLRVGAYQLMFLDNVPNAVACDETVALARHGGLDRAAGLVNAVLRKLSEQHPKGLRWADLRKDPVRHVADWGSLPVWLAERWVKELGPEQAAELAQVCVRPPPRSVRVSPGQDLDALAERLNGRRGTYAPACLTELRMDPVRDEGFDRGEFTIQDEASQLVCLLVAAQPGDTVVDCCAAPGTKTVQLAQDVGPRGEVIALELHTPRVALIHRSASRLGLHNVRPIQRDASKAFDLQGRAYFKRMLVDAPCSGLGTLRRNPDARWHLQPAEIERCAEKALAILGNVARYVEPGGVLVYSVCTFTPEETRGVLTRFLEQEPDFQVDDPRPWLPEPAHALVDGDGAVRTLPHLHGCDGFYAVRLSRHDGRRPGVPSRR
jgi:16S rRNA (cytosine967-C5)-methyltransferase